MVEPADGRGLLSFPQIVIGADFRDPAMGDDDGAIPVAPERPVSGRVNQEPADSEGIGIGFHGSANLAELTRIEPEGTALPTKKRIRAAHAEKQQIRETCRRPNRLNLCDLTANGGRRSKYSYSQLCNLRVQNALSACARSSSVAAALWAAREPRCFSPSGPQGRCYRRSSAWCAVPALGALAASSRTSWRSDLNSHFSRAAMSAG